VTADKHAMRLRDVTPGDLALYERLRCDPEMMAELGGPLPRSGVPDKLRRDVAAVERDEYWVSVIESDVGEAMGSVVLWQHEPDGETISEIGWMVLPEFQGRGLGKAATAALIDRARADRRWGAIHAFPGVTNAPSNGICRSLGFTLLETRDIEFEDRTITANHWRLDPAPARDA
jgi:RimJ/RimL family protein N-acetyltransferase